MQPHTIEQAITKLRALPPAAQRDVAQFLVRVAEYEDDTYLLSADEAEAIEKAAGELSAHGPVPEEKIRELFERLGA